MGWKIIVLPVAVLSVMRMTLMPRFPTTHALVHDWFSHAVYLFLFLPGIMLAPTPLFGIAPVKADAAVTRLPQQAAA